MTDFIEKHYSIDPGMGKKMDGCPYSIYEDGHDVKDYIIPPKGYVFVGFHFDPEASNQIYDGKLIAQYAKEPFNQRIMANLWKFILAFVIIAVIALIAVLVAGVFKEPTPKPSRPTQKPTPVVVDTDTMAVITANNYESTDSVGNIKPAEDILPVSSETNEQQAEPKQEASQQIEKQQDTISHPDIAYDVKFKSGFWTLIHQRTILMDPYDNLYKENKNKVQGEEFDYLRFTILKDYSTFKAWSGKLHKIPVSDLESINTISDLKNKLHEIE